MVTFKGYADPLIPEHNTPSGISIVKYVGTDTSVGDHGERRADGSDTTYDGWTFTKGEVPPSPPPTGVNAEVSKEKKISLATGIVGSSELTMFQMNQHTNLKSAALRFRIKSTGGSIASGNTVQPVLISFRLGRFLGTADYTYEIFAAGVMTILHGVFGGFENYQVTLSEEILLPLREALLEPSGSYPEPQRSAVFCEYQVDASYAAMTGGDTLPFLLSELSLLAEIENVVAIAGGIAAPNEITTSAMIGSFISFGGIPSGEQLQNGEPGEDGYSQIHKLMHVNNPDLSQEIALINAIDESGAGTPFSVDLTNRNVLLPGLASTARVGMQAIRNEYPGHPISFTLRA